MGLIARLFGKKPADRRKLEPRRATYIPPMLPRPDAPEPYRPAPGDEPTMIAVAIAASAPAFAPTHAALSGCDMPAPTPQDDLAIPPVDGEQSVGETDFCPGKAAGSLRSKFAEYDRDNPDIYLMFRKFALEALAAGRKTLSANLIFERMRWETSVVGGEDFKVNNNYRPDYARKFMREHAAHGDCFRTRALTS